MNGTSKQNLKLKTQKLKVQIKNFNTAHVAELVYAQASEAWSARTCRFDPDRGHLISQVIH